MFRQSDAPRQPAWVGVLFGESRLLSRDLAPKLVVLLVMLSSAVGVWVTLSSIGAAHLDLALAKWIQVLALTALIAGSTWGDLYARLLAQREGIRAPADFLDLAFSKIKDVHEYGAVAALLGGAYVLVAYTLHFAERLGPWYNGIIGLQGFMLFGLASVVLAGNMESPARDKGLFRLVSWLAISCLLLLAALDVVPYALA